MKLIKSNIAIPATSGQETIANSKWFNWIDPDFKNWDCDVASGATEKTKVEIYILEKNSTFAEMFRELGKSENLILTQHQILEFLKNGEKELGNLWGLFFLFKIKNEFFVARAGRRVGGERVVSVRRLSDDDVWRAGIRDRVVVPQLSAKPSVIDPLKLGHFETCGIYGLNERVKILKEKLQKIVEKYL